MEKKTLLLAYILEKYTFRLNSEIVPVIGWTSVISIVNECRYKNNREVGKIFFIRSFIKKYFSIHFEGRLIVGFKT